MSTPKHRIAAGLGALLLSTNLAACAHHDQPVGIGTAVSVERNTALGGLTPGEDAAERAEERSASCGEAVGDMPDGAGAWLSDELVQRCDYRVTGLTCYEDEVCAVAQIRATGGFGR